MVQAQEKNSDILLYIVISIIICASIIFMAENIDPSQFNTATQFVENDVSSFSYEQ